MDLYMISIKKVMGFTLEVMNVLLMMRQYVLGGTV